MEGEASGEQTKFTRVLAAWEAEPTAYESCFLYGCVSGNWTGDSLVIKKKNPTQLKNLLLSYITS